MSKIPENIKESIIKYINYLENSKIHVLQAILYGSYAEGNYNEFSDIDLALVSESFSGTKFFDIDMLRDAKFAINTDISPMPYRPEDFTPDDLFAREILKNGIRIV